MHTDRMRPITENIAGAGGNACMKTASEKKTKNLAVAYKSSNSLKDRTVNEAMQAAGDRLDVLHQKAVSRIVKCIGLISEYIED